MDEKETISDRKWTEARKQIASSFRMASGFEHEFCIGFYPQNDKEMILLSKINSYDLYIQNNLIPTIQASPFYENSKNELMTLLGDIKSEGKGIRKAEILYWDNNDIKDYETLLLENFTLHNALLMVLMNHLLRSLGFIISYMELSKESDYYGLLSWYANNNNIQSKVSKLLVIREFFEYTQAFVNVENRLSKTFNTIKKDRKLTNNSKSKIKYETFQWNLCKIADSDANVDELKNAKDKINEYRKDWVHRCTEKSVSELFKNQNGIINLIQLSYKSVVLKYEGLYRWYLDPDAYSLGV